MTLGLTASIRTAMIVDRHCSRNKHRGPSTHDSPSNRDRNRHKRQFSGSESSEEEHYNVIPAVSLFDIPSHVQKSDIIKSMMEFRVTYKNLTYPVKGSQCLYTENSAHIEFFHHSDLTRFVNITKGVLTISGCPVVVRHAKTSDLIDSLSSSLYYLGADQAQRTLDDPEACNVLILKGLDHETTEEAVRNAVCHLTNKIVYDVRLIRDKITNVSRGFCFVEMGDIDGARSLLSFIRRMDPPFSIDHRRIVAGYAKNNFGFSCNTKSQNNSVASNAIAAARAANAALPVHLQDNKSQPTQSSETVTPGDPSTYYFDPTSNYYIDPSTNFYYDSNTGTFYNPYTQQFLYLDEKTKILIPFATNTQDLLYNILVCARIKLGKELQVPSRRRVCFDFCLI
ncbi:RNA-binding protein 5 [Thelohanellus kitauei]|uniref:RNA-binding protein 5 n=1 Tax=Thelohanellus kitauei TaxID=669202 RepID=A0A0C2JRP2_THEKT|nr:RNA-binding protein 5 [Thelohanellus kitauei]